MANFIEVTIGKGKKELLNTHVIESIYAIDGGSEIKFTKEVSRATASIKVADGYESLKKALGL